MKVAVGLSGGVDSSVAAAILKNQGHDVVGVTMRIWEGDDTANVGRHACYGPGEMEDIEEARRVAESLEIPFEVFDLSKEYDEIVLRYFREEYVRGHTPNPCLRCNPRMKFGKLVDAVKSSGIDIDKFATGHYARVARDSAGGRFLLMKAKDLSKDQSYGLIFLTQEQLDITLLPLGEISKKEVRSIAKDLGLRTHDIPDSQDFYSGDYSELIDATPNPGPIVDMNGNVLGEHDGLWKFTIGQRKGLGLSTPEPMYVKGLDHSTNTVIVAGKDEIYNSEMTVGGMNFISVERLDGPGEFDVRIRHTPGSSRATVSPIGSGRIHVKFREPQWAITPGQIAALYNGDIVVGGGIIEQ